MKFVFTNDMLTSILIYFTVPKCFLIAKLGMGAITLNNHQLQQIKMPTLKCTALIFYLPETLPAAQNIHN